MNEWISVEERLPEDNETVWVHGSEESAALGTLNLDKRKNPAFWWYALRDGAEVKDVTHWMLIKEPNPPMPKYGEDGYTPEESEVPISTGEGNDG